MNTCPPVFIFFIVVLALFVLDMIVNSINGNVISETIRLLISILSTIVISVVLWLLCSFLPKYGNEVTMLIAIIGIVIKSLQSILNIAQTVRIYL